MELTLILAFIPTMLFISITPGMCMTLAMVLGMTIGVRYTLWMMLGELFGVSLVALSAVLGAAALILQYPVAFDILKYAGGVYIIYLGIQMCRAKGGLALDAAATHRSVANHIVLPWKLVMQGFVTATANPKGWAFMLVILPPFINADMDLVPQLSMLLLMIICIEFVCLLLYASGGHMLRQLLTNRQRVKRLNVISGMFMCLVGVWLMLA